jgi:hypothetical protein
MRSLLLRKVLEEAFQQLLQLPVVRHREREGKRIGEAIQDVHEDITG